MINEIELRGTLKTTNPNTDEIYQAVKTYARHYVGDRNELDYEIESIIDGQVEFRIVYKAPQKNKNLNL